MPEILYQDAHYIAINKPSALLVHRSPVDRHETRFAVQLLRDRVGRYVYPVHRLDKPTSGVLLFAFAPDFIAPLSGALEKEYLAVVRGWCDNDGVIDHPICYKIDKKSDDVRDKKRPCKEAVTAYETVARTRIPHSAGRYDNERYSLVRAFPKTGRKHQLRRHFKHIAHHIIGDTKYGRGEHNKLFRKVYNSDRLLLHARRMRFTHPYTQERIVIEAGFDTTFLRILELFKENG